MVKNNKRLSKKLFMDLMTASNIIPVEDSYKVKRDVEVDYWGKKYYYSNYYIRSVEGITILADRFNGDLDIHIYYTKKMFRDRCRVLLDNIVDKGLSNNKVTLYLEIDKNKSKRVKELLELGQMDNNELDQIIKYMEGFINEMV